ncbi:hypothetical protein M758_12G050700 [Ceratodon purpureus]|nr:hypothetical protein M758_12G050700 [Ceratodon purpureus]
MEDSHGIDDNGHSKGREDAEGDRDYSINPFEIQPKGPVDRLKEWRKVTFTVNAARRFRYTLDIKKFEEQQRLKKDPASRLRAGTHVIRAVERFKQAGRGAEQDEPPGGFGVGPKKLVHLLQDRKLSDLEKLGKVQGLAGKLGVDLEEGVKDGPEEIQKRKEAYGANTYPKKKAKGIWHFVWEACQDTTLIILMVAAVVSLGTEMWSQGVKEGWYDGTAILAAVFIVIVTTAGSDYKQSLQFRNLNAEKENIILSVIRGGERKKISIWDIVVGDVIPLSIGDQVPADGIFMEGHSLLIDESTMTGESEPVRKDSKRPFLMSGCKVIDGQGIMLVTGVGINTEWGQVMASVSEDNGEETPLQVRLNGVATFIGKVGLTVAVLVFVILFIRFFAIDYKKPQYKKPSKIIVQIVEMFSIAVTIVVVAVPEGLPLAVTLTLAYSMRKMMADKSLVRHLAACETMGSATTICSDKTGTLTTNKMTVVRAWLGNAENDAVDSDEFIPHNLHQTIIRSICLNSTGTVAAAKGDAEPVISGSPTETACLGWGLKLGMDFKQLRHATRILHVETFNSTKKRAGVVFKNDEGIVEAHWKGAAEIILGLCTKFVDEHGEPQEMSPEKRTELENVIGGMAAKSLRCIAFAYRPIEGSNVPTNEEESSEWKQPEDNLILLGICGIKDPCRNGVREAVERCQHAGVKVRMVTGDNVITARAIAQECGILKDDGLVVEGPDFRTWDDARLDRDLEKLVVMARSSPTDKLKLVKSLKQRGNVVAVTGDGTNDAPALHEADIGLSMGISGTEVAKESSDIIILDDNFTSVVKVVRWGRSVYSNIQKFIQFQLTVNVTALTINFISSISTGKVPLTAVQLLWVNLIMDTLGALALATEPPTDDLMDLKPVGRTEPLITNIMWRNILAQAIFQIVVLLTLDFAGNSILKLSPNDGPTDKSLLKDDDEPRDVLRTTIIFNAFVFCQVFNEINARRPTTFNIFQGIHKNYLFISIIVVEVILQFVIVQFLNRFARTTKLEAKYWGLCIVIGFISWPVGFLVKFLPVPKKQFQPRLNLCCGLWGKKKKSKAKDSLDATESIPKESEQTNDPIAVTSNHHGGNISDADNRRLPSNGEIHDGEKTHVVSAV